MKRDAIAIVLFFISLCSMAQVTNRALSFERNGRVSLGTLPTETASEGMTLQLWMNPQHWIPGANIVTWGDNLNIQLGTLGETMIKRTLPLLQAPQALTR